MIDSNTKIFVGPMSKNVVDAIIEVNNNSNMKIGFIPSRRQVEYNGGYVNNWTTKSFSEYVKLQNSSIILERDHGGPGQGYQMDNGSKSFKVDAEHFDIIHIDPWKKYQKYKDGLRETVSNINLCHLINSSCCYEIGTEESIRYFSIEEFRRMIADIKKLLSEEVFSKIKYAVIQSGVGLSLGEQKNIGVFNSDKLKKMVKICKEYNLYSKEHNGDYLSLIEIKNRFKLGLDAINIAPEFGQLETEVYLDIIKELEKSVFDEFYKICYKSKRWEKWIESSFDPIQEKEKIIKISGHYVFANTDFIQLKNKISDALCIPVSKLDKKVKDKIKEHILSFKEIIKRGGKFENY